MNSFLLAMIRVVCPLPAVCSGRDKTEDLIGVKGQDPSRYAVLLAEVRRRLEAAERSTCIGGLICLRTILRQTSVNLEKKYDPALLLTTLPSVPALAE